MDYAATYQNVATRYCSSGMNLNKHINSAYLLSPNSKSRVAGYYLLSRNLINAPPFINAPVLVVLKTLKHTVSSDTESETSGFFMNAQIELSVRHALESLGHPQPPTPVKTENYTTSGLVHGSMQQKRYKSWYMRYHWLRDK